MSPDNQEGIDAATPGDTVLVHDGLYTGELDGPFCYGEGKVEAIGEQICIIDVGGVGYEVQASARALRVADSTASSSGASLRIIAT